MSTLYIEEDLTEDLVHVGDVVIEGDVAAGVKLLVHQGHVFVDGDVQPDAEIRQFSDEPTHGIEIARSTHDNAIIAANGPVSIAGAVGMGGDVSSRTGHITVGAVGDGASLSAERDILVGQSIASSASLTSTEGNITAGGGVGAYSKLDAPKGEIAIGGAIGFGAELEAGKSIRCQNVAPKSKLRSGGSIEAGFVSRQATLDAKGNTTQKGQSNDAGYGYDR